jgi:hypothetical protein
MTDIKAGYENGRWGGQFKPSQLILDDLLKLQASLSNCELESITSLSDTSRNHYPCSKITLSFF